MKKNPFLDAALSAADDVMNNHKGEFKDILQKEEALELLPKDLLKKTVLSPSR